MHPNTPLETALLDIVRDAPMPVCSLEAERQLKKRRINAPVERIFKTMLALARDGWLQHGGFVPFGNDTLYAFCPGTGRTPSAPASLLDAPAPARRERRIVPAPTSAPSAHSAPHGDRQYPETCQRPECGQTFYVEKARVGKAKYCSLSCRSVMNGRLGNRNK